MNKNITFIDTPQIKTGKTDTHTVNTNVKALLRDITEKAKDSNQREAIIASLQECRAES
jgi:hypothetical protein